MSENELYKPFESKHSYLDCLIQGFASMTVDEPAPVDDTTTGIPDVVRNPLTGDLMISPRFQEVINQELAGAREAVSNRLAVLVRELSPEHKQAALCAAILEGAVVLAICCFEEEALAAKWTELQEQGRGFTDGLLNIASAILVNRMVSERRGSQEGLAPSFPPCRIPHP